VARRQELEEELEVTRKSLSDRLKDAKVKANNLNAQLKQSEHRVKARTPPLVHHGSQGGLDVGVDRCATGVVCR
jgi:hypothetical protein